MGDPHTVPAPAAPRVHPEPRRDHGEDTALTISRKAHLQSDYTALGQVTAAGEGHATASGAADRTTDERGAPGEGARVEAATNTASEPTGPPPGTPPALGAGAPRLRTLGGRSQLPRRTSGTSGEPRPGPLDPQAYRRGAARPGSQHPMAAYFAVPPPRGGNPHHGRRHLWPADGADAPRHHGPPRPMALCGHPAHGAYGGLQPG